MFLAKKSIIAGIIALMVPACESNIVRYDIPDSYVDISVYLSDPSSFNLTVVGGSLWMPNEGYGGVLIYRRYYNQAFDDFAAYELACPTHWADGCGTLEHTAGSLYITCPCPDGHTYQVFDGQSTDTNHVLPVKEYTASFDGINLLTVVN